MDAEKQRLSDYADACASKGFTQRQLAERLGVSETMVSRDERKEYHGITVDRARRALDALGARLVTRVSIGAA